MSEPANWVTVDELVEHLVMRRHGLSRVSPRTVFLEQHQGQLRRRFDNPVTVVRDDIYRKLAEGTLVAFGELKEVPAGQPRHRQIEPIEWSTLSLNCKAPGTPFVRFRVKLQNVERIWPSSECDEPANAKTVAPQKKAIGTQSPFEYHSARAIFDTNQGWPDRSQGKAARELAALYSNEFKGEQQPSSTTVEAWVRRWSIDDRITRPPKKG